MRMQSVGQIGLGLRRSVRVLAQGALLAALPIALGAASASAAPPVLWEGCRAVEPAVGRRCAIPRGIAVDPTGGHVFVGDQVGRRVVELSALGEFIRTWGWDVVEGGGTGFEICTPEEGEECKPGVLGAGAGQFSVALGLAVDGEGSVYVTDSTNRRVEKFDGRGSFELMFGGEVNKTKVEAVGATEEEEDICPFDPGDECKAGVSGTAPGQFGAWGIGDVITVAPSDKVYVGDQNRIQSFNVEGVFQGQCSVPGTVQSLANDSSGNLYATYNNQFDVRKLAYVGGGECQELERFDLPEPDPFTRPRPIAVAVDAAGDVYAFGDASVGNGVVPLDRIFKFDPAGNIVEAFGKDEFSTSTGLATNLCPGSEAPGNLFVSNSVNTVGPPQSKEPFVRAYGSEPIGCFKARTLPATNITETGATLNGTVNPNGALSSECRFEYGTTTAYGNIAPCTESPAQIGTGSEPVAVHADLVLGTLQAATTYHFRLRAKVGGETESGPDLTLKTLGPPVISADHLESATSDEATLRALVNPEGLATECHVDYGLSAAYGQGSPVVAIGSDRSEHAVPTILTGLQAGTTYHWRYACNNTATLNGGITQGDDHELATYRASVPPAPCANDAFRSGYPATLPDCRAYEMVSPVDKNGGDIIVVNGSLPNGYVQVSPDGEKITYASLFPAFGSEPPSSARINQYLAIRQAGSGWANEALHPPLLGQSIAGIAAGAFRESIAFSPDLCSAWLVDYQTPPLNLDAQEQAANLYRRQSCGPGAGGFETLTDAPLGLEGEARSKYVDQYSVQGVSADSRHAIFVAKAPLAGDAAAGTNAQTYDRFGDAIHLVSVKPSGAPGDPTPGDGRGFADPAGSAVGSGWGGNLERAVSEDGSRVYWTSGASEEGTGRIYLRSHPEQGILAGECSDPALACTTPVSAVSPGSSAFFWAASTDGAKALYSEGDLEAGTATLHEFDVEGGASHVLAQHVMGVAGTSKDLSRVYFVSRDKLSGSGENSEEADAVEGEPNLYLAEGGGFDFVATLVDGDVGKAEPDAPGGITAYDLVSQSTLKRATRVSPDGAHIAFESRAPLMRSFDNTIVGSGKPAVEVFNYEAGGALLCVSCSPSGASPIGRELREPYHSEAAAGTRVRAAAFIPTWEQPLHASNLLSDDGNRLFFDANDALLPRDTDGAQDVYEWEAPGTGSCDAQAPDFFAKDGGCLYLISSGDSPFESQFWEASPDGRDVFFTTESSLLPQDPSSVDLYDARVGGGYPQPEQHAPCEGEACQSPPAQPAFPAPASGFARGLGTLPSHKRCSKGRHMARRHRKTRCFAKSRAGVAHRRRY